MTLDFPIMEAALSIISTVVLAVLVILNKDAKIKELHALVKEKQTEIERLKKEMRKYDEKLQIAEKKIGECARQDSIRKQNRPLFATGRDHDDD